jgi:hypothetical protein
MVSNVIKWKCKMKKKKGPKKSLPTRIGDFSQKAILNDGRFAYETRVILNSLEFGMTLYTADKQLISSAAYLLAEEMVRDFAKIELMMSKFIENVVWKSISKLGGSESPMSKDRLRSALTLEHIWLEDNGNTTVAFEGEFLDGHCLMIYGNSQGKFDSFDTPG